MNLKFPTSVNAILSKGDYAGGVSEELISSIEQQRELRFPDEYREFLKEYGAVLLSGFEIYGLVESSHSDEAPPVWSDLRMLFRNSATRQMPRDLVPISDDGGDFKFYVKCNFTRSTPDVGGVVVYGPGADGLLVSESFFEFLERAAAEGPHSLIPLG